MVVAACFVPNVHDKGCLDVRFALPRTEIIPPDKTSLTITAYASSWCDSNYNAVLSCH